MTSRSTKVTSFKSNTIREAFPSDAINDFNSGRFSSLIRPISVRTTSPFALRRILNTQRPMQSDSQRDRMKRGHLCGQLTPSSRQMSESRQTTASVRFSIADDRGFNCTDATSSGTHRCEHFGANRRDRFGDGAGRAPDNQKPSHDLLAGANFGDGAESSGGLVNVEGLLMRGGVHHGCHDDRFKFPPES